MPEVVVPFLVLGGFLALVVALLLLAVRRARRGFAWSDGAGGFSRDATDPAPDATADD